MRIGILTYYKCSNFGANLQAVSNYEFLTAAGHDVIFINYVSWYTRYSQNRNLKVSAQMRLHFSFIDERIKKQSPILTSSRQIMEFVYDNKIEALIIGSDAVLQHFPLFSTWKWGQSVRRWMRPIQGERRFPNPFWGCGLADKIPTAMISVSSQNSPYKKYSSRTLRSMRIALRNMCYISLRDSWTQEMVSHIDASLDTRITPDPVFAFNKNAGHLVPSKKEILEKFRLPEKYVLIGLRGNSLSETAISELEVGFLEKGMKCISFPISGGESKIKLPQISLPLSPLDWYGLLCYAQAYIGSNMHPIVICLHNAIPCYSIDNWGTTDFWGRSISDNSSKVLDILSRYGLENFRSEVSEGECKVKAKDILYYIDHFPIKQVRSKSESLFIEYKKAMEEAIYVLAKSIKNK